jgi:single-stranded-DNA-specific exonuclease
LKGSARTDGSVSVITLLQGAGNSLLHSGGHEGAGGFAIDETQLHILETSLCASYVTHARVDVAEPIAGEILHMHEATPHLLKELDLLRPFGEGNPKPLWTIHGRASRVRPFGKDMNHTEIMLTHESGVTLRTYRFFSNPEDLGVASLENALVGIVGTLEKNTYKRGVVEVRIAAFTQ